MTAGYLYIRTSLGESWEVSRREERQAGCSFHSQSPVQTVQCSGVARQQD